MDTPLVKATYVVSAAMTREKMAEKKEQVTSSQLETASYLRRLEATPDASTVEYAGLRYKG